MDTIIFGKFIKRLHKGTTVSFVSVLPGSQSFRQKTVSYDYKELTPFSSTLVLWISWRDVLVLIPSAAEPLYIGYCIWQNILSFNISVVFLDAKEKEV